MVEPSACKHNKYYHHHYHHQCEMSLTLIAGGESRTILEGPAVEGDQNIFGFRHLPFLDFFSVSLE